jgi:hypothetical protein
VLLANSCRNPATMVVLRALVLQLLLANLTFGASMFRVREVEGNSTLTVYRDVDQPNAFYFVPTIFGLNNLAGQGQRLGVQIYSDEKSRNGINASLTLSVAAAATQSQISEVLGNIRQQFKLDNPKLTPVPRIKTRIVAYRVAEVTSTAVSATPWSNSVVEASQSISFELSRISKSDLRRLLSADKAAIAVALEIQLDSVVDGIASGTIHGDRVQNLASKRGYVFQGSDFDLFLSEILDRAVDIAPQDKPFLRDATRSWINQKLGPASLFRVNQKLVYGWQLGSSGLATAADGSMRVVLGSPHIDTSAAVVDLGNLCSSSPTAIVNLDDGTSGCGSLR